MTSRFTNVILCWISFYVVLLYTAVWCHCISYQSRLYLRCSASWQITAGRSLYKHELIEDKFFPHSIVLGKYSTIHSYIQLNLPVLTLRQFCSVHFDIHSCKISMQFSDCDLCIINNISEVYKHPFSSAHQNTTK